MSKYSFDEVTKEELLDSIKALSDALGYALNFVPCDADYDISSYRACRCALNEHSYLVYSETYELPG